MSEDATPRFYLGVGAQRCGTTWLARYLDEHPDIGITPFKECHYWTSKYTYHQNLAVLSFVGLKDRLPKLWSHIVAHPGDAPRLLWGMLGMSFHNDALYRSFLLTAARKAAIASSVWRAGRWRVTAMKPLIRCPPPGMRHCLPATRALCRSPRSTGCWRAPPIAGPVPPSDG